jgi:hypothetical protein
LTLIPEMTTPRVRFLSIILCALAACSKATAPTRFPAPLHDVEDTAKYPLEAAGFEREQIIAFAPGLDHTSTAYGYLADDLQIAATIEFTPRESAASDLAERFQTEKTKAVEHWPGARLRGEDAVVLEKKGVEYAARKATYEFEAMFRGQRQQLYAEVFVWSAGESWVSLRSMAPSWQRKKASAKNRELLGAIDWSA